MKRILPSGRLALLLVVAAAVAAPSVAQAQPVRRRLAAAGLLPERAAFSTLAIKQYQALYATVSYYGDVQFDVVATNSSTTARRYTWDATAGPSGGERSVGAGVVDIAADSKIEIALQFRLADCGARNKIAVRLTTQGEHSAEVHYWVLPRGSAEWLISRGASCVR